MNRKGIIITITGSFIIASLLSLFMVQVMTPKQAFVRNQQVFEAFAGKQELAIKLESQQKRHQQLLDSLSLEVQLLQSSSTPDLIALQKKKQLFFQLQKEFAQEDQQQSQTYTAQIQSQISQFIKQYGEIEGYDYIFGANGDGGIVYAVTDNDITEEVIHYINQKYEGN